MEIILKKKILNSNVSTGFFQESQKLLGDCVFNKWNDLSSEFRLSQSATKLNIADMFFYLSKQKKLHSLVIIMFLGFCSQMPQKDI